MKTVNMFDCKVAALALNDTIAEIDKIIEKRIPTQHVVINAGKVVLMEQDRKLKKIIQDCKIINADGQSIVWASNILGTPLPERVTGIDIMEELIKLAAQKGHSIYFFGAKNEVVERVVNHYQGMYPNLRVAGYRNGYFKDHDNPKIVEDIRDSRADILLVAFSSPKKEYWLAEHLEELNVPFSMGVGGSFDVVAGVTKRAPVWMQKAGLEWFYRFLQEPKRMWKRYLVGNTKFIIAVFKEKGKEIR
ncbi:WecB/TagA/CpsF family glycosyltransferase [Bacillus mycoides]|uniref:WecB/TagA/CpsF family glycosyltransferase n=1 Tax=Bacillus mycoides TaxID=1405 RepID=UPI0028536C2F|nr:WecB/TagA/CpsF family glycosyltransferase [Bacillus mycoides]MDR4899897.1 WecB/TagA/CpsF family glycosyltransferase [Bacillus mycoides]MED1087445.1 WecB/TagA/CpsF family glycosyltransferase [Bacillus mycoides]